MSDEKLVTVHGNKQTLNLPNVFYTQIISSSYFKNILFKFVTYPEVVNFAKKEVKSLEPNFRNDNPTTLFYFVYKFHTLKLTINQLKALFKHKGCSLIRAIGFIYARFAINPNEIWDWLYDYIDDGEKVLETANPENYITIGQLVRRLLTENKYMDKHQLPRIPIPIQREKLKLLDKVDKYDDDDEESDDKNRNRRDRRDRSRDRRDRSRSRSRERNRRRDSRSRSRDRRDRSRSRDRNRRGSRDRSRDRSRERRNRSRSRSRERNTRRDSRSRSRDRRDRSRSRDRNRRDSRDRSRDRSRERRNRSRSRSRDRRDRSRERDSVRDKRSRSTSSDRDQYHSKRNKNSSERSTDEPVSRSNASPPKKKLSMQQIEEMKRRYAGGTASINTTPQTKSDTKQEFVHLGYNN